MVAMMVGRYQQPLLPVKGAAGREPRLVVENLLVPGAALALVSGAARRNPGFCRLVGAGRTELMEILFG